MGGVKRATRLALGFHDARQVVHALVEDVDRPLGLYQLAVDEDVLSSRVAAGRIGRERFGVVRCEDDGVRQAVGFDASFVRSGDHLHDHGKRRDEKHQKHKRLHDESRAVPGSTVVIVAAAQAGKVDAHQAPPLTLRRATEVEPWSVCTVSRPSV